jgi:hypothetical protein
VIYPGSTPVGNATLVVANVLTCNKHSPEVQNTLWHCTLVPKGPLWGFNLVCAIASVHKLLNLSRFVYALAACGAAWRLCGVQAGELGAT